MYLCAKFAQEKDNMIEEERKEKKLYGIVEAVVKSVKNKTINIHRVFTKEYAKKFVDVDDLDSRYEVVRDWIDSLPYILSINEKNWGKEFGTVKLADYDYEVNGVEVACFVIKNISADFCIDGETFLHPEMMNRGVVPNILFTPDALWDGWKENFMYFWSETEHEIQFFATSNFVSEDLNLMDPNQGTDLMRLEEVFQCWEDENHNPIEDEEDEPTEDEEIEDESFDEEYEDDEEDDEEATYTKPLGIYGFMASLINAMFKDAVRRKIFSIDWYDENWTTVVCVTSPHMKILNDECLPKHLHVPGQYVFAAYMEQALPALRQKLEFEDIEYEHKVGYTMRKMLEIEVEQSKLFEESKLWKAFPVAVQKTLRQYHNLFIKWLRKNLGDDEPKVPEVKDPKEIHYHIEGNVGQLIGNVERMNSNKDERE